MSGPKTLARFNIPFSPRVTVRPVKGSTLLGVSGTYEGQIAFFFLGDNRLAGNLENDERTFIMHKDGDTIQNPQLLIFISEVLLPNSFIFVFEQMPDATHAAWLQRSRLT